MSDRKKLSDYTEEELNNLDAETLAELSEDDDGQVNLETDQQNYTIDGIEELNAGTPGDDDEPGDNNGDESGDDAGKPTEPADEIGEPTKTDEADDYKAKYEEIMAKLAESALMATDTGKPTEPEPEPDKRTPYEQLVDSIELTPEEQAKYESYKEYDEDQANMYQNQVKQEKLLSQVVNNQQKIVQERNTEKENARKSQEETYVDAIGQSDNLKTWQKDDSTWEEVNMMHKNMLRNPDYSKLTPKDQMAKLEQRYSKFTGVKSDTMPEPGKDPDPIPTDDPKVKQKIADVESKTAPPTSLSSVASGTDDIVKGNGKIHMDNSTDALDIQLLIDKAAESDDPEAIDKLLSSIDFE